MKKIINYIIILLFAAGIGYQANAQGGRSPLLKENGGASMRRPPNAGRRLESIKIEYLKKQLNLNDPESDKFWPVYSQYQGELKELGVMRQLNNTSTQPDASKELAFEQKLLNIRQHYHEEFLKILPLEKVNLLYKSESEFKYELLRHIREGKPAEEN